MEARSPWSRVPATSARRPRPTTTAIFADTTAYRQREGAPTHNAGVADPSDAGRVDPDGHPRVGDGRVDIGADELPPPPAVDTGAASAITANSADVAGSVDGRGQAVVYAFEYGTTPALGFATAEQPTGSTSLTTVQGTLTGLPPSRTIYYRIRARLTGVQERTAVGDTASFTTLQGSAPAVNLAISGLAVTPKRFEVGSELPQVARVGTAITFGLSADARVTLRFFRKKSGRRVDGKCRRKTRANRDNRRCTRLVPKGKFAYGAQAGDQRIAFEGPLSDTQEAAPGPVQAGRAREARVGCQVEEGDGYVQAPAQALATLICRLPGGIG